MNSKILIFAENVLRQIAEGFAYYNSPGWNCRWTFHMYVRCPVPSIFSSGFWEGWAHCCKKMWSCKTFWRRSRAQQLMLLNWTNRYLRHIHCAMVLLRPCWTSNVWPTRVFLTCKRITSELERSCAWRWSWYETAFLRREPVSSHNTTTVCSLSANFENGRGA